MTDIATLELLSSEDVAQLLGVSAHTVRDWAAEGRLAHFKVGHLLRFTPAQISEFLKERPAR